jgi:protein gp37
MNPDWVRQTREECAYSGVKFFFKQWGGTQKIDGVAGGHELDGQVYHAMPEVNP